jgi:hypothetical protein
MLSGMLKLLAGPISTTPVGSSIMCKRYTTLLDFLAILAAILEANSDFFEKSIGTKMFFMVVEFSGLN